MSRWEVMFQVLTGKPTGRRPLGRPISREEANITIDFKYIGV